MSTLMSPLSLRGVRFPNRVMMSPMTQHSAGPDGRATDWHFVHYASRAVGGVGWILLEDTAVVPEGRIGEQILGLWDDAHVEPLHRIVRFCQEQGSRVGIQLAHAGRRAFGASKGRGPDRTVAPSAIAYDEGWRVPHALTADEIAGVVAAFVAAAGRALAAGFDFIEIHAAHGYLLHQFLSPLSNRRGDAYGGDLEGRARLLYQVTEAVRAAWPEPAPLLARLSASDLAEGGLTPGDIAAVGRRLRGLGVDMLDLSWGGILPHGSGARGILAFQEDLPPEEKLRVIAGIRKESGLPVAASGVASSPRDAEAVLTAEAVDVVAVGRALLANPYWTQHAARELGDATRWPRPYKVLST